jgi:uncharacterized protein
MPNPLLINAAELMRRPGTEKIFELHPALADLQIVDDPRFAPDAVADVRLRLESLSDSIVVDGHVRVPWHGVCRRCLESTAGVTDSVVNELYQYVVTDPEAFEIVGEQVDLGQMVRELVVLDAPHTPLCKDDCAGLCPSCGMDLNAGTCSCTPAPTDLRWSALEALKGIVPADEG